MYKMEQSSVEEHEKWSIEVIENIKVEIESTSEPAFIVNNGMELKQESYGNWTGTGDNQYDANLDVCKEEPSLNSLKSEESSEITVNTLYPETNSCTNKRAELLGNCEKSKSPSYYMGYSARHEKLEPSVKYEPSSADCTPTSGSSAEISTIDNNVRGNITSLVKNRNQITHKYKEMHVDENTNINYTGNKFEVTIKLEKEFDSHEAASVIKEKCHSVTKDRKETTDRQTHKRKHVKKNNVISEAYSNNVYQKELNLETSSKTIQNEGSLVKEHKTIESVFSCVVCNRKFDRKHRLKCHMMTHTGEKPFSCTLCNYKCRQKGALVTHMRTHTGEKPFSCDYCNYKSRQKGSLDYHMRTHTGEKPYSCELCSYKCGTRGSLNIHMKTHTGDNLFSCHLCDSKFGRKSSLDIHIRTHTGEKPFSCSLCDFKCRCRSTLGGHMKTHNVEKPFSCDHCSYRCRLKYMLVRHMTIHTGEKPFSCKLCNYKCSRKSNLGIHMRTHTGQKLFSCKVCHLKYILKANFINHMSTHTGEKHFEGT